MKFLIGGEYTARLDIRLAYLIYYLYRLIETLPILPRIRILWPLLENPIFIAIL
jgi:hypothetical protein